MPSESTFILHDSDWTPADTCILCCRDTRGGLPAPRTDDSPANYQSVTMKLKMLKWARAVDVIASRLPGAPFAIFK